MQQITILETWQVLFFLCVCAMHPGTWSHCKNGCVSRTSQKTQLSVNIAQTEELIASIDNYCQQRLDIHMKSGGLSL